MWCEVFQPITDRSKQKRNYFDIQLKLLLLCLQGHTIDLVLEFRENFQY